ncbi:hypothetical protein KL928_004958 [Ogataea angusta]|uniref:C2H2-type domain-containing protein n=1 Tax=Pichia angusta TaxID=870730 RepID=A0AAN6I4J6_PICAN|nr:uncharacterized protein KL928_004958 [Ogataea angusta]KAG7816402.1 hypothetical protein KL928_004958 [Ogataea angusta]
MSTSRPQYTCNSCSLAFSRPEDQRSHMKTDWHRYNLKRRVSQLPPITEELFNEKVGNITITSEGNDIREGLSGVDAKQMTKKEQRRLEKEALLEKKKQLLEIAKRRMISSNDQVPVHDDIKAERAEVESLPNDGKGKPMLFDNTQDQANDVYDEDWKTEQLIDQKIKNKVEIPSDTCMFCGYVSLDLDGNIDHMFKSHGLYIPEMSYLVDKAGLISYLSEKIGLGNMCLSCNFQGRNIESVRQHMRAKGHCKIPYETLDEKMEISEFYNFESSYFRNTEAGATDTDEEWEDLSDDGAGEGSEDEVSTDDLYTNGYELYLPSGHVAGHRSLMRYYKQNLKPDRELTEGQGTLIAAETRHFVQPFDRKELQAKKRVWARQEKLKDINDRRSAKFINHQAHYRDQLLQ